MCETKYYSKREKSIMTNKVVFKNYGVQQNWVNGKYHPSTSEKTISVISPYFDKEIATVPESNFADLNYAVKKAQAAFLIVVCIKYPR